VGWVGKDVRLDEAMRWYKRCNREFMTSPQLAAMRATWPVTVGGMRKKRLNVQGKSAVVNENARINW